MKALRIHGIKDVRVDTVDDPIIEESRDAIIRVTSTAICGSDLHLYNGGFPQPRPMTLGHEFMGIVEEVGKGVTNLKRGDRVVVPFPIACGGCFFCNHDLPGHCENSNPEHYGPEGGVLKEKGGGLFGFGDLYGGYNGGQAEYVRVPYADYGPRKVPDSLNDDQVLFLTDIFPTGYSAIDWANVQGGETVVIFGAGPVGIMAAKSAWLRGAARVVNVDTQQYRLDKAKQAANSEGILWNSHDQVIEEIRNMTDGRGADVCVEAVGFEPDRDLIDRAKAVINLEKGSAKVLEACFSAVRRGGVVSVVGIYSVPYDNFPIGQFFEKGFSIVGGQALVHKHIDKLLEHVVEGRVKLDDVITHRLSLDDAVNGYDIFRNKKDNCTKVVLKP